MTRHHALGLAALVLIGSSPAAAAIHRGPATRDSTATAHPIVISSVDRVRIETVWDPARVPGPLRGKFVGSVAGLNHENLTVVLSDGQPAIVHRDLVKQLEVASQHGPRWKHTLIGAGIGAGLAGGLAIASETNDNPLEVKDSVAAGMVVLGAGLGALTGFVIGKTGKKRVLLYQSK